MERARSRARPKKSLNDQIRHKAFSRIRTKKKEYDGDFGTVISTGSTLLDLAISAGRIHGGGLPRGIFVEIYGPESSGKTAIICEIGGNIQKKGGECQYHDPEGRIDTQHALMFGIDIDSKNYHQPNTVPEVFKPIREWNPKGNEVHGILVDSLAALSTNQEMDNEEGDKMGGRRGKEFSEGLRKACRLLKQKNYLMVCSNQIRDTFAKFGKKTESPGGKAIRFYASIRLETKIIKTLKSKKTFRGKAIEKAIGVQIQVDVIKSSIWKPKRTATLTIIFDYGIDDIRENLQFIKDFSKKKIYTLNKDNIGQSMDDAINYIESNNLEKKLKKEVVDLWEEIESKFESDRKPKRR